MLIDQIVQFLMQNPIAMKAVIIMVGARAVFKPLCIGIQAYVDASDDEGKDNALWAKVKENKIFKTLEFILDYAFSIKLPKA